MSPFQMKASIEAPDFREFKNSGISKAFTHAAQNAMGKFAQKHLSDRFDGKKSSELQYSRRDPNYRRGRRRSMRKPVHDHNLTGQSRRTAMQTKKIKVVNRRDGMRKMTLEVSGLGPQYGRRRKPGKIDLNAELARISERETKDVMEHAARAFADYLKNNRLATKRRKATP